MDASVPPERYAMDAADGPKNDEDVPFHHLDRIRAR